MYYQRFEDLPVWNDAIALAVRLLEISQAGHLGGVGDLKSQIERAAISISNNIAEGFERGTNEELLSFLYIAKGSAAEVRSMLHLLEKLPRTRELSPQINELLGRVENVSRQLGRWIESLKDSSYRGKRYQNTATRRASEAAERGERFMTIVREAQDAVIAAQRAAPVAETGPAGAEETKSPTPSQGSHTSGGPRAGPDA